MSASRARAFPQHANLVSVGAGVPEMKEFIIRRPIARMQGEGEVVAVAQDKGAVRIAAGLIGIEAEVALIEAARAHLIGDADPDMSEVRGQQDR